MSARLTKILALIAAITGIVVGCGDDSDSSSAAQRPSKIAFSKMASEACIRERAPSSNEITAYLKKHRSEGLPKAVLAANAYKAVLHSTVEAEIAALRKLDVPVGDGGRLEAILDDLQSVIDRQRARKNMSTAEIKAGFAKGDEDLRRYGLVSCTKIG